MLPSSPGWSFYYAFNSFVPPCAYHEVLRTRCLRLQVSALGSTLTHSHSLQFCCMVIAQPLFACLLCRLRRLLVISPNTFCEVFAASCFHLQLSAVGFIFCLRLSVPVYVCRRRPISCLCVVSSTFRYGTIKCRFAIPLFLRSFKA